MEEKRQPQMPKARDLLPHKTVTTCGPALLVTGEWVGLGWEVGGSGVGREGMGEQQATGSSSVPALLPPPTSCTSFGRMLRDALRPLSPCALLWGRCRPRGAPGSRQGQAHGVKDPPHSVVFLTYCLFPPGSDWPCGGRGGGREPCKNALVGTGIGCWFINDSSVNWSKACCIKVK